MVCSLPHISVTMNSTMPSCHGDLKYRWNCDMSVLILENTWGWVVDKNQKFSHRCVGQRLQSQCTRRVYWAVRATRCLDWDPRVFASRVEVLSDGVKKAKLTKSKLANKVIVCELWAKEKELKTAANDRKKWNDGHTGSKEDTVQISKILRKILSCGFHVCWNV